MFIYSIAELFKKIFKFKGQTQRTEFNLGILFIALVTSALTSISVISVMGDVLKYVEGNPSALNNISAPFSFPYIVGIITNLAWLVLLCAPLYRRIMDAFDSKPFAVIAVVLFSVGTLLNNNLLLLFLSEEAILILSPLIIGVWTAGIVMVIIGMFKPSKYCI